MKSKAVRDYERKQKWLREVSEMYEQMTPWHKFEFMVFIHWLYMKQRIKSAPLDWIKFVVDMERQFEIHGMPFAIKMKLEKWFNLPPYTDVKEYFLWKDQKVWHYSFLEEENFELHLRYKGQMPGHIWFQLGKDGTATIIGIHIHKEFRNTGLGTRAFQESIKQLKGKIISIKGILEKEDYPEPESSFRWLRRQGFEIKEKENGDYEIELKIS